MGRAMSVKCRNSTHYKNCQRHHHEKTHRFELSGHDSPLENHTPFSLTTFYLQCRSGVCFIALTIRRLEKSWRIECVTADKQPVETAALEESQTLAGPYCRQYIGTSAKTKRV
jgi:hypothetical protein